MSRHQAHGRPCCWRLLSFQRPLQEKERNTSNREKRESGRSPASGGLFSVPVIPAQKAQLSTATRLISLSYEPVETVSAFS
jgi:hypothetical protein